MSNQEIHAPVDHSVRLEALNPNKSFAVSAPAGSGKTGLLTQRVLTLLALCNQPEEILAITFTRKAASEMQDRIINSLWEAMENECPVDGHGFLTWNLANAVLKRDKEMGWNLLQCPHRLRIQTIDSLCRAITRQLPFSSGLGAQSETLDDSNLAYRLAIRELFKHLDKDSSISENLANLLRHLDNNLPAVENLLTTLLAKREQWLGVLLQSRHVDARNYLESVLSDVVNEHLCQLSSVLQIYAGELCFIADKAAANLQIEADRKNKIPDLLGISSMPGTSSENLPLWQSIADLLLTNGGTYRARLTKAEGFPAGKENADLKARFNELVSAIAESFPGFEELLNDTRTLPPTRYEDDQWALLDTLTSILPVLAAELLIVFKQQNATDYAAISQAAIQALGDEDSPSDLALQLDHRISHILVDEFQDTASPQLELLQRLTSGWQSGDGRTMFIVGDGMQSCYGFRNANVGIFLDARKTGIGSVPLEPLDLSVNFRSQSMVVDWINRVFKPSFPAVDDIGRGAVSYSPSTAFKAGLDGKAVEVHVCGYSTDKTSDSVDGGDTLGKSAAQMDEAELVVSLVKQAKERDPEGTIAILVRTRTHLQNILPALSMAGLNYQATEIDRLSSRMVIMDLLSLTKAMLNPADRISWLSILRAPWCGLDNSDLHRLVTYRLGDINPVATENSFSVIWTQIQNYIAIPGLSASGLAILNRVVPLIEMALQNRFRKPLRQWVEGLWFSMGGPAALTNSLDGDNIRSFFALLDKHDHGGGISDWSAFNQGVERLFAAPHPEADHRLQVMTIHKSKGLEFDTVIIPGLDRNARKDDKQLLLWQERINRHGQKQLMLGSLSAVGAEDSDLYTYMRKEADKQQSFESTRLLYVGCTRAIKYLHLVSCLPIKDDGFSSPSKNSLISCIWPFIKEEAISPAVLGSSAATDSFHTPGLQNILRLGEGWEMPQLHNNELLKKYRGHELVLDDESNPRNLPEFETAMNRLARHSGIVIHSILQSFVERNIGITAVVNDEVVINQSTIDMAKTQLMQFGWRGDYLMAGLNKVANAIITTFKSPVGLWVIDSKHEASECELSMLMQDGEDFRELIIDRTFIHNGVRWIIDYKSSNPAENESIEAFMHREMLHYKPQLDRYASLFDGNTKTALYFPSIGKLGQY